MASNTPATDGLAPVQSGSWTNILLLLLTLLALLNLKNLPLVWTFRLFTFLFQSRGWLTPTHQITNIFQPIVMRTRSPLFECDYYLHKNNATFFTDIDIARWHLMGTLISPIIRNPPPGLTHGKAKRGMLAVVLGGVACTFKREIKPYEKYEVWTRVLCWDEKWVFFVTHFVRAGKIKRSGWSLQPWKKTFTLEKGQANEIPPEKAILASAVSKCIFRHGKETVAPETVFRADGLLPTLADKDGNDSWSAATVEEERLRGMKVAEAMDGLNLAHAAFEPFKGPVLAEYGDVWAWS